MPKESGEPREQSDEKEALKLLKEAMLGVTGRDLPEDLVEKVLSEMGEDQEGWIHSILLNMALDADERKKINKKTEEELRAEYKEKFWDKKREELIKKYSS